MDEELKWFHCTTHTYGAWLHGEARGFRTRHHREHIEGDYKNPPPEGKYAYKLERSKKLMTQDAVSLEPEWRAIIGAALVEKLQELDVQLLCLSMSSTHAHLLGKMPPGPVPRQLVGLAKKHAKFVCNEKGWEGKLWAVRSKPNPIKDRPHQLNTYYYILRHINEGAWVWDFRRGVISSLELKSAESPGTEVPGESLDE
jgi:hypothetical protein